METPQGRENSDVELDLVKIRITFARAVADWCLRQARTVFERGNIGAALEWNHLAARTFSRGCRPLVLETLERNLLEIASLLPRFSWSPRPEGTAPKRWLHVIDNALPYGGHTTMARRWITTEMGSGVHSIALPKQLGPVPAALADEVRKSGGEVFLPVPNASLLSRATWLRELAYAKADCVVLHISGDDVVAPAAFGVDGGPPVLLVNQSAHTFWTGASVLDRVINCRGSELERFWTQNYRGISNASTLPIPVQPPQKFPVYTAEERAQARQKLNLPADAVVLLSVGREEKYEPVEGLNFFEVAHSLLASLPQAWMLIAGPSTNSYRTKLSEDLDGRLAAVGMQLDLQTYYAAADVYLESFPFGSTTALLEAGVHGLPCVLAPRDCPPPFGTDGVALDDELQRPANVEEYVSRVRELIMRPEERLHCGASLAQSIRRHHCGDGWTQYLSELKEHLPQVHSIRPIAQPPSPPEEFDHYWTRSYGRFMGDPFFIAFTEALSRGISPGLDVPLYRACRAAKRVRFQKGSRLQATVPVLLSALMPVFPAAAKKVLYRGMMYFLGLKRRLISSRQRKSGARAGLGESVAAV